MLCSATKFNIQFLIFNHIAQPNQNLKLKVKTKFIKPSKLRQWSSNYTIVRAKDLEACLPEPLIARCKPNVFLTLPYVGREVRPHKEKNYLIGKYKDDQ